MRTQLPTRWLCPSGSGQRSISPFMSRLTGKDEKQLAEELTGVIYRIPGTDAQYVTADEYLSGNVRQKAARSKAGSAV